MTRIKICGITTHRELTDVVELGADAVGFVVSVPRDTHRELGVEQAEELIEAAPPFVSTVLVTMGDDPKSVIDLYDRLHPDAVQLHGDVSVTALQEIRAEVDPTIIVATEPTGDRVERLASTADGILFDSAHPDGTGGTGEVTDWVRAAEHRTALKTPIILAGGLDSSNVTTAIEAVDPYAVDVSSGVEGPDGKKDQQQVAELIDGVRRAEVAVA